MGRVIRLGGHKGGAALAARRSTAADWARDLLALLKMPQTGLLTLTGVLAYLIGRGKNVDPIELIWAATSLSLSIGGATTLNMVIDRDIDALMVRTLARPLAAGRMKPLTGTLLGIALLAAGLCASFALNSLFAAVVSVGAMFSIVVYTLWLKRRSPLSTVFGGIAGGMPALAGRVLAVGRIDTVGLLLVAWILFWIPSHVLSISMRCSEDYRRAGVPVWPNVYGRRSARVFIACANLMSSLFVVACGVLLRIRFGTLALFIAMSLAVFASSVFQLVSLHGQHRWSISKIPSFYMLAAWIVLAAGGFF